MKARASAHICMALATVLCAAFLTKTEARLVITWTGFATGTGLLFLPVCSWLFPGFQDGGFAYSFTAGGLLLPGYVLWVFGVLAHVPFTMASCVLSESLVLLSTVLFFVLTKKSSKRPKTKITWETVAEEILMFLTVFTFFVYIIGFNPGAYGTERFMDFGILNNLLKGNALPPEDIWMSGEPVNYYYGGQYFCAYLAKLLGTKANYAYNLSRAMVPALLFTGAFSLVSQMNADAKTGHPKRWGFFSAMTVVFAGNGHYLLYGFFGRLAGKGYWFPDSTRFIGFQSEKVTDGTIHEFPAYSFILGDLHAHMINTIFVIVYLASLYSLLRKSKKSREERESVLLPETFFSGLLIGIFQWTNYWDFIIYGTVCVICNIGYALSREWTSKKRAAAVTAVRISVTAAVSAAAAYPFTSKFRSIFKGVKFCTHHSAFWQMCVLWGLPVLMCAVFIISTIRRLAAAKTFRKIPADRIYGFILACCAIGLIAIPEIVYVVDIYEATNARANTMFKLTYQAFIMFSLLTGYILPKWSARRSPAWLSTVGLSLSVLFAISWLYFFQASADWFSGYLTSPQKRQEISATAYLEDSEDFKEDKGAIEWMIKKQVPYGTVLEAPGASYTAYERVSVSTGLPTLAGWMTHEWLWRDSLDEYRKREKAASVIYTGAAGWEEAVKRYRIKYIFVGAREREKYGSRLDESTIKKMGHIIYQDSGAFVLET